MNTEQTESKDVKGLKATVLNKNNLALHKLAPNKHMYYLDGVHVTDDFTEVTNGHYLARVSTIRQDREEMPDDLNGNSPTVKPVETIIKAEDAKEIEAALPKSNLPIVDQKTWFISQSEEKIELGAFQKNWSVKPLDGRFPTTDTIWPKDTPSIEIGFNVEYMEKLCAFIKKSFKTKHRDPVAKLTIYSDSKPMRIDAEDENREQSIEMLLMPVKI